MSYVLSFKRELYSKEALFMAANEFLDEYYIHLDCTENTFDVIIENKVNSTTSVDRHLFENELLLQETRRLVHKRTGLLREMMYARAMASTVIDDFENDLEDTMENAEENVKNAEDILIDWFDGYEE